MEFEDYKKRITKVIENYYKKHFENPNENFDDFLNSFNTRKNVIL